MPLQNIRSAVHRLGAQRYLLTSLISFAATVVLTRLFLEITGYPQLGSGQLHIAHVLWGGLILFVATLLPILFANRWALEACAVMSGIGIGLFIDEVGKFITSNNDYFFPAAAPIIYAFFLLTVMLYLRIRRTTASNSRHQLYHVLESMTEILDHDLETDEREDLVRRLEHVKDDADNPNLAELAHTLLNYVKAESLTVHSVRLTSLEKIERKIQNLEKSLITRMRMRIGLMISLLLVGSFAWYEIAVMIPSLASRGKFVETILMAGLQRGEIRSAVGAIWFFIHLGMQGLVGALAFASSTLMAAHKDKFAVSLGTACLVISLTAVNLLAFFVDQFSTAGIAMFQLLVLVSLNSYRSRFIDQKILN